MVIKKVEAGIWMLTDGRWGYVDTIEASNLSAKLIREVRSMARNSVIQFNHESDPENN